MSHTKKRVRQHIMEERSVRIIRDTLPEEWLIREYKPDYGIDLTIELFEFIDHEGEVTATLGETVFVQVKSKRKVERTARRVAARRNVEVSPLAASPEETTEIEVISFPIETSELLTVQAIGACVPVLLFLVDLSDESIYYVCLNDLIEKVILPEDPEYASKATKTIHIPAENRITRENPGTALPIATYAKRPKLYAAFEKFRYQRKHVDEAAHLASRSARWDIGEGGEEETAFLSLVRHFLSIALRYDFWERMPEWKPIEWAHQDLAALSEFLREADDFYNDPRLREYLVKGGPLSRVLPDFLDESDERRAQALFYMQVQGVWHRLDNLGDMYEELVREWFLPTYLSTLLVDRDSLL